MAKIPNWSRDDDSYVDMKWDHDVYDYSVYVMKPSRTTIGEDEWRVFVEGRDVFELDDIYPNVKDVMNIGKGENNPERALITKLPNKENARSDAVRWMRNHKDMSPVDGWHRVPEKEHGGKSPVFVKDDEDVMLYVGDGTVDDLEKVVQLFVDGEFQGYVSEERSKEDAVDTMMDVMRRYPDSIDDEGNLSR